MTQIPINKATMAVYLFADDIISYFDENPEAKSNFYQWKIHQETAQETLDEMADTTDGQFKIATALLNADKAIDTVRKTCEAVSVLYYDDFARELMMVPALTFDVTAYKVDGEEGNEQS